MHFSSFLSLAKTALYLCKRQQQRAVVVVVLSVEVLVVQVVLATKHKLNNGFLFGVASTGTADKTAD